MSSMKFRNNFKKMARAEHCELIFKFIFVFSDKDDLKDDFFYFFFGQVIRIYFNDLVSRSR